MAIKIKNTIKSYFNRSKSALQVFCACQSATLIYVKVIILLGLSTFYLNFIYLFQRDLFFQNRSNCFFATFGRIFTCIKFCDIIEFKLLACGFAEGGFIEGFITRYGEQMPWFLSYGIIACSLFLILFYYVIYPIKLNNAYQFDLKK